MIKAYRSALRLSKKNLTKLGQVNAIVNEYLAQGYRLTLRQLYYQLVSRDLILNNAQEYKKLTNLCVKGRMGGVIDWDAIEDRLRVPQLPYWVHGIADALNDTIGHYRLNRMENQDNYIEVWVEKDALSSVLSRVTRKYHVNLMVNRGYSSASAMHVAYKRFEVAKNNGQNPIILYLGDHDPSGLDMIRDVGSRIDEFADYDGFATPMVDVQHIALTGAQIGQYDPPANYAKITDPRSKWYKDEFGDSSWEVDALEPKLLHELLEDKILENINVAEWEAYVEHEENDKAELREIAERYNQ